ncbi:cytochrome c4 [Candidatus Methylopumilus planktonicus]|jgi:cytochrome c553|nr:c-type cytochrome [Candidatus Methylopumilus sp.]QDD11522.1 cytochrome c4 [Candidatus Methylopumilus planktonicus]QDD23992.1 cytochrome c4 [Candidatus Methylopumilus planktonicus]
MSGRNAFFIIILSFLISSTAISETIAQKTPPKSVANVCAACHGVDGNSAISANPKLSGQHPEYLYKQLTNFKSGARANAVMSGMAGMLSDADMHLVAEYYSKQTLSLGQAKTNGSGSLGEKIYRAGIQANAVPACASCHGPTGDGLPVKYPRLGGQHTEYVLNQLRQFRLGARANDEAKVMRTIAAKLTDQEMEAVADYIQGLR